MMPSFLNAAFLAGLAGVAIPLLIHLLNRERVRRVDFGWQRFLVAAHQERMRHFKIRQLLLLRMLVCALLALAFARPFLRDAEADQVLAARPTYAAVVVDVSYSMGYGKWLQRARRQVLEIADSLASGDQMSLLAAGGEVRTLVGWTDQLQLVRAAAREKLKPTYAPTDLGTAFRVAEERLRLAPPGPKKLYIISDHQESGWGRLDRGDRIDQGIELALIDVGDPGRGNLAVVDVQPAAGDGALLMARLRHFGGVQWDRCPCAW